MQPSQQSNNQLMRAYAYNPMFRTQLSGCAAVCCTIPRKPRGENLASPLAAEYVY